MNERAPGAPLRPAGRAPRLSRVQESCFVAMDRGVAFEQFAAVFHLRGRWDRSVIAEAMAQLTERHQILRTCYPQAGGGRAPLVLSHGDELEALPPAVLREGEWRENPVLSEFCAREFHLGSAAPSRAGVTATAAGDLVLSIVVHPVASDVMSQHILARDLTHYLRSLAARESRPAPALPCQYLDFADWETYRIGGEPLLEDLPGLPSILTDVAPARVIQCGSDADRPRSSISYPMSDSLELALREQGEREQVPPFVIACAAMLLWLSRWSGQDVIAMAVPLVMRPKWTSHLVGPFTDTMVLTIDLACAATLRDLFWQIRARWSDSNDVMQPALRRAGEGASSARSSGPRVSFSCFGVARAPDSSSLTRMTSIRAADRSMAVRAISARVKPQSWAGSRGEYELSMSIHRGLAGLQIDCDYDATIFDSTRMQLRAQELISLLERVGRDSSLSVAELRARARDTFDAAAAVNQALAGL
jgi:hypothetical protein